MGVVFQKLYPVCCHGFLKKELFHGFEGKQPPPPRKLGKFGSLQKDFQIKFKICMKKFRKSSNILECLQDIVPVLSKSNGKLKSRQKDGFWQKPAKFFNDFQKSQTKTYLIIIQWRSQKLFLMGVKLGCGRSSRGLRNFENFTQFFKGKNL